jgi:hypothetical protein
MAKEWQSLHGLNKTAKNPTLRIMLSGTKVGKPVMRLAKSLLAVTSASLIFVGTVSLVRNAYAQDADQTYQSEGVWGAPDEGLAAKTKAKPLDVKGCWSGEVVDAGDGSGTATFQFDQTSNLKKLKIGTTFNFQWADSAFAEGPLKGSVSSTGIKFKGNAGAGCTITGSGTGDATALTGTFEFVGTCATTFQDVTFSIAPGCQ